MFNYAQSPLLAGIRGWGIQPPVPDQNELLEQLIMGISQYYVHLIIKQSALAIDPVQQLRLFYSAGDGKSRPNFLRRLLRIINGMYDRHTTIRLPAPWNRLVAYIPFIAESFFIGNQEYYVVTKQLYGFDEIPIGAIISHWNGVPIRLQVARLAAESQGANRASGMRLGLANLTIRPLEYVLMPEEDWATITYFDPSGQLKTASIPWRFYQIPEPTAMGGIGTGSAPVGLEMALGLDSQLLTVNRFKKDSVTSDSRKKVEPNNLLDLKDNPLGIRYGPVKVANGNVGYMRIFTFEVPDVSAFLNACQEILAGLPQDRLIIDIRSNPGGIISAGQKLIRMLTSKETISPSPVAFRSTMETRNLATLPAFAPWLQSLNLQYVTGESFSQALPMTTYEDVPDYRYSGKIALIIDSLCYSTCDYFAADFKDNNVGLIVGIDPQTGGGGANVWTWDVLQSMVQYIGGGLKPLPGGFGFNLAVRRSIRTGAKLGIPVEDLGVEADILYYPTLDDVFGDNKQLIDFTAAQIT